MLDIKRLRSDINTVAIQLKRRGFTLDVDRFKALESRRKVLQMRTQELQNERNTRSKSIGQAKAKGEDIQPLLAQVADLGGQLKSAETALLALQVEVQTLVMEIPNLLSDDVPEGKNEEDNVEIRRWGEPQHFTFEAKDHVDLGEKNKGMDFEAGVKLAGSRFVVLNGSMARLHRALIQFMLDTHTAEHGYQEVYVPYLVNADSLKGTGQLPKFEDDLFKLQGDHEYYLIPTAEVPVTNLLRGEIIEEKRLPLKYTAHTPCFRSEAGSYGRDTRGLIRQHQFEKVEILQMVKAEDSWQALDEITAQAEAILQKLAESLIPQVNFGSARGVKPGS